MVIGASPGKHPSSEPACRNPLSSYELGAFRTPYSPHSLYNPDFPPLLAAFFGTRENNTIYPDSDSAALTAETTIRI